MNVEWGYFESVGKTKCKSKIHIVINTHVCLNSTCFSFTMIIFVWCLFVLFCFASQKNAQSWGCFQHLTQFSHCSGLKWVSVTKESLYLGRAEPLTDSYKVKGADLKRTQEENTLAEGQHQEAYSILLGQALSPCMYRCTLLVAGVRQLLHKLHKGQCCCILPIDIGF